MQIRIFDVEHGFCAIITSDAGQLTLIDCGHSVQRFSPSLYFRLNGIREIDRLIISNYDEDHISDLPDVRRQVNIPALYRNNTITAAELRAVKAQGGQISHGMSSLLDMIGTYVYDVSWDPLGSGFEFQCFFNPYPVFEDTNNLSVVTFIHYRDINIVFPGDLEESGWQMLLLNPQFRAHLERTTLFVASHHGRRNGYCPEVFRHCHPELVILSDHNIRYETQEFDYGPVASGAWVGNKMRWVLTTRRDGDIFIAQDAYGPRSIHTFQRSTPVTRF